MQRGCGTAPGSQEPFPPKPLLKPQDPRWEERRRQSLFTEDPRSYTGAAWRCSGLNTPLLGAPVPEP